MIDRVIKTVKLGLRLGEAVWFYVRSLTKKVMEDDILFLASGLAFNGVLSMIPLLLLSASALGTFLNSSELGIRQLNDVLDTLFPPQPFAISIKESILTVISDMVEYRTSLGVFGVLVLVWTASSLFDSVRSALHKIYGIRKTRSLLAGLLHDMGFVLLAFVLFVASNVSIWVFSLLDGLAKSIPALAVFDFTAFSRGVPTFIMPLLTAFMFYIIYRYIPDSKPPKAAGVISTITTTVLWVISGRLFAIYLSTFSSISKIYGPYAFILVLLIWIYYSSLIFVFGGMVGQVYWERRRLREAGRLERWV